MYNQNSFIKGKKSTRYQNHFLLWFVAWFRVAQATVPFSTVGLSDLSAGKVVNLVDRNGLALFWNVELNWAWSHPKSFINVKNKRIHIVRVPTYTRRCAPQITDFTVIFLSLYSWVRPVPKNVLFALLCVGSIHNKCLIVLYETGML